MKIRSCDYRQLFPALSNQEIAQQEQRIGQCIPDQYRSFLLEFNGIKVLGDYWFPYSREHRNMNMGEISAIFGISSEAEPYSIDWALKIPWFAERGPKELLPIGLDYNGYMICLNRHSDAIMLWTDDGFGNGPANNIENVMPLFDRFQAFIDAIEAVDTDF